MPVAMLAIRCHQRSDPIQAGQVMTGLYGAQPPIAFCFRLVNSLPGRYTWVSNHLNSIHNSCGVVDTRP